MTSLFVERLTVIDCGLLDRARGLVGVSWVVDAEFAGAVDDTGMILDFGPAKRLVKQCIDRLVDHRLLVPGNAPGLTMTTGAGATELEFTDDRGGRIQHRAPEQTVRIVAATAVGPEQVARELEREIADALPANVSGLCLTLYEEAIDGGGYNYCHGLRKHGGQCQNIGHGHRSRLEIFEDGRRSRAQEQRWCRRWRDVFLGNRADLVSPLGAARYRFAYRAEAGRFELELDAGRCELLPGETTVENIASFIAEALGREQPGTEFTVRAYEGVDKGAVVTTS